MSMSIPTLDQLHSILPSASVASPLVVDTVLDKETKPRPGKLTLFRERNGWCPYSERVFLAFESKELSYDTFLIENMGSRPDWYGGTTPQVRWEDGSQQSESMDIVYQLDKRYPDTTPQLNGVPGTESEVKTMVSRFKTTFPRNARPSSRAAFLYYSSGMTVFRSEFEETLKNTDKWLSQWEGPFFLGEQFTAADVAWAPFLERYAAQLPALHKGLTVRDREKYPYLCEWFDGMFSVPAYAARVAGDPESWRKVLAMQGYGNDGVIPDIIEETNNVPNQLSTEKSNSVYQIYAHGKEHLADTPSREAAAKILRNFTPIKADILRRSNELSELEVEEGLRGLISGLAEEKEDSRFLLDHRGVKEVAAYLTERICVPRDMGFLSARALYAFNKSCASQ